MNQRPTVHERSRAAHLAAGLVAALAAFASGCGAADADASSGTSAAGASAESAAASASDLLAFVESARGAAASRHRTDVGRPAAGATSDDRGPTLTRSRPRGYATALERPPLDAFEPGRLAPEDVVVSFAMLAEAGRFADQWPLLSEASRAAWSARIRREAGRIGRASVEARAAEDPRRLWAEAFAADAVRVDLDVAWRTTASIRDAEVVVHRDDITIDVVRFVREDGAWRMDLADRIDASP